jgi:U4/U6.U5 tri-snRNP-associated protein 2
VLYCRDYFLVPANYKGVDNVLVKRFGELIRKLWNSRNFKGQVR